ncbi:MAG: choice-of-anchor R domain-containing protein [Planctomycetia bacterium]
MDDGFPDTRHPGSRQDAAAMNRCFASSFQRAFVAVVVFVLSSAFTAQAGILVYTNVPNGPDDLADTGSDFGPSASTLKILAQGFTTGSNPSLLTLQSVQMGAFFNETSSAARTVSIYTNSGGNPGSLVATSSPVSVQGKGLYTFAFDPIDLAASTSYFVVPQFNVDWFWYITESEEQPVGVNGSGYVYLSTRRSNGTLAGTWSNTSQAYAVSVVAVPEPAPLLLVAAGAAGLVGLRQRRKVVARGA